MTTSDAGSRSSEDITGGSVGIISMLLLLAGIILGPAKLVSTNSPVSKIVASVSAHSQQVAVSDTLVVLGGVLFLGFVSVVAHRLRLVTRAEFLSLWLVGAAVTFVTFAVLDNLVLTAMTFVSRQEDLAKEPALTLLLYHLYNGILMPGIAQLGFAAFFAVFAVAAWQGAIKPRWLRWPCMILAPLAVVNGVVGLTASNGGAFALAPLAVLGFVIVVTAHSVSLLRSRPTAPNLEAHKPPIPTTTAQ